jgi:hypothetical protein
LLLRLAVLKISPILPLMDGAADGVLYLSLRKFAQPPFQDVPLSGFREGGRGMGKNLSALLDKNFS